MAIRERITEEPLEGEFEQSIIEINRCAKVHKGGRKFSFSALVVVGNRKGQVSYGHGKANEVPPAVEKAVKNASECAPCRFWAIRCRTA